MAALRSRCFFVPRVAGFVRASLLAPNTKTTSNPNLFAIYAVKKQENYSTKPCYSKESVGEPLFYLRKLMAEKNIQLFDVRNPEEVFEDGKIPGAVNIPLTDFESAFALSPVVFEFVYRAPMPKKSDNNIVIHCISGEHAQEAIDILKENGFTGEHYFTGSWDEWQEALRKDTESASC
ncbi:thiosulfate:glutathione sulfurtransferase [Nematostella vectensis]|uniref:thiosulfate:glutathione sulfurtransferase n=1 Tax=Nematostella vectensis TaxID=45351 RepID=UPI0020778B36|nr:thiosulfate:glutathione sulfurtransferase [Nematostella vectensis]